MLGKTTLAFMFDMFLRLTLIIKLSSSSCFGVQSGLMSLKSESVRIDSESSEPLNCVFLVMGKESFYVGRVFILTASGIKVFCFTKAIYGVPAPIVCYFLNSATLVLDNLTIAAGGGLLVDLLVSGSSYFGVMSREA